MNLVKLTMFLSISVSSKYFRPNNYVAFLNQDHQQVALLQVCLYHLIGVGLVPYSPTNSLKQLSLTIKPQLEKYFLNYVREKERFIFKFLLQLVPLAGIQLKTRCYFLLCLQNIGPRTHYIPKKCLLNRASKTGRESKKNSISRQYYGKCSRC